MTDTPTLNVAPILTPRLELVPATPLLLRAALTGPVAQAGPVAQGGAVALGGALRAVVPAGWPPQDLDDTALQFTLDRLLAAPDQAGWWMHFVLLGHGSAGRTLVGCAGFAGPPTEDGTVEIGYGIVAEHQRRGFATEAARGMLDRAFGIASVRRVIAETLPDLTPSIGVLHKCGFRRIGDGAEPGTIRFERTREEHEGP